MLLRAEQAKQRLASQVGVRWEGRGELTVSEDGRLGGAAGLREETAAAFVWRSTVGC